MSVCPRNACAGGYGRCLDVKFTNACNGACEFCIEKNGFCPVPEPVAKMAAATLADESETILVLGGEPMTRMEDLVKYLAAIRPFKQHVYMTTNGSLLDRTTAEAVAPYLDGLNISVHHWNPVKNDAVYRTCQVDFDKLAEAIAILRNRDRPVKVRINANLTKNFLDNREDIRKFIDFAADVLHADEIRFSELQGCEDLWVNSRDVMPNGHRLPADPFTDGCEQEIRIRPDIRIVAKMCCGLVCDARKPVDENAWAAMRDQAPRHRTTRVLYPDGIVRNGWLTAMPDPEPQTRHTARPRAEELHEYADLGCHGPFSFFNSNGCH